MVDSQLSDHPASPLSATSSKQAVKAELEQGSAFHKQGVLNRAAQHYAAALNMLEIAWDELATSSSFKNVPKDADAADALHWLGALRIQQIAKDCDEVGEEEDNAPEIAPVSPVSTQMPRRTLSDERLVEVEKWLALLRAAIVALPEGSESGKRARTLNSVGIALLLLGPVGYDEAASVLREAVSLAPTSWPARSNLVKALKKKARDANPDVQVALETEAIDSLQEMSRIRPNHPGIFYRLGMSLRHIGRIDDAIKALEQHLRAAELVSKAIASPASEVPGAFASWKTANARHWLAVMKGDNTATAPPEYVASLFDDYAERFEEHLVQKLNYSTPSLIAEDISKLSLPVSTWRRVADLGCGTGLMCPPLRRLGFIGQIEGVDLSEGMLLQALKKGRPGVGYDRLLCGDSLEIFQPLPELVDGECDVKVERVSDLTDSTGVPVDTSSFYDLVVAADVFVYVGDLAPTFQKVKQWLKSSGIFAFSTEALDSQESVPFKLNQTGRYTHTTAYVRELAMDAKFSVSSCRSVVLRMNAGEPVNGHIYVLSHAP